VNGRARYHRAPMARTDTTALSVAHREASGSRAARRLRRQGNELRQALAHAGAVLDLSIDGGTSTPVVLKELARHPVSGDTVHVDLMRVRLDQAIQATVVLELLGVETAPGVKDGGVLEHVTRELTVEALPTDIPDSIQHDVEEMQIGDTLTVAQITAPAAVTLLDDPETVIATITPPRLQVEEETEIEEETEVVGGGGAAPEAEAASEEGGAEADSSE
jgi:large subunit ribosomal protein L25